MGKKEYICPDCSGSGVIVYEEPNDKELCSKCESRGTIFLDEDEGKEKCYIALNDYLDNI